ncbi:MAG: 23S rRNA (cytosine(1962)-C(5))-methyltransferase RlmI, partial [Chloroflexi bacterium]
MKSHDGKFLARGYWNPKSQIEVRLLTWQDESIDDEWWRRMLKRAIDARSDYKHAHSNAYRLINAENDFVPGLIVDRYDDWLVIQALTLGIDQRKHKIVENITADLTMPLGIYERSDVDVRDKEGLKQVTGVLWGESPPEYVEIIEHGLHLLVDIRNGQKTGYYL